MRTRMLLVLGLSLTAAGCGGSATDSTADPATSKATPTTSTASASPSPSPSATQPPSSAPAPSPPPPTKPSRRVLWYKLEPAMCVLDTGKADDEALQVTVTDCNARHHSEVTQRLTLPGGRSWPGTETVDAAVEKACVSAFSPYVGLGYEDSLLEWDAYSPTRETWETGMRTVVCLVLDPDTETTSRSLKGSAK